MSFPGLEPGTTILVQTFDEQTEPHHHHPLEVALKVIPVMNEFSPELIRKELKAVTQLHLARASGSAVRRILPFIGTATLPFYTVIIAEFMQNGNMLQYLKHKPAANRQHLLIQVADAVCWLHDSVNLAHGDLKCENVLIDDKGNALLADFGLSTAVEKEESSVTTATGIRNMHTLPFAAPELLFGLQQLAANQPSGTGKPETRVKPRSKTRASDVYAFGMLIVQAFTGMRPWSHLGNEAIYWQIFSGALHPRPLDDTKLLGLSDPWWAVCVRCWTFNPCKRPMMQVVLKDLLANRCEQRCLTLPDKLGHSEEVSAVNYTLCGTRAVASSSHGIIRLFDVVSGEFTVIRMLGNMKYVWSVAVSPDGLQIASCGDRLVCRWDAKSGALLGQPMAGHDQGPVICVAYSPNGSRLVSGSNDSTLCLWDTATGQAVRVLRGHTRSVRSVAWSLDGTWIASGSSDKTIRVWPAATGEDKALAILSGHDGIVSSVCYLPNGDYIVSASSDCTVRMWSVEARQLHRIFMPGHTDWVRSVVVSPSGMHIASCSDDGTIRLWDVESGAAVPTRMTVSKEWLYSVSFSPEGRSLVSGSSNGSVRIWFLDDIVN